MLHECKSGVDIMRYEIRIPCKYPHWHFFRFGFSIQTLFIEYYKKNIIHKQIGRR